MKINDNTNISLPVRNLIALLAAVGMGIFAYTEITGRLTSLETQSKLIAKDIDSANQFIIGVPKGKMVSPQIQELFYLVEDLYKATEKLEKNQEQNMTNKVNIEFLSNQLNKALKDIEKLKDKVRANGTSHQ